MDDKKFTEGIYFNQPLSNAPDFVLGSISIQVDQFVDWLSAQRTSEKGYVKLDVKLSRAGKPYIQLNDWQPKTSQNNYEGNDVPF